jgi:hypothetical protein
MDAVRILRRSSSAWIQADGLMAHRSDRDEQHDIRAVLDQGRAEVRPDQGRHDAEGGALARVASIP